MAGRLMDAGYSLCAYDTQSEATKPLVARGSRLAKSPAEVASSADIVLASLPTPDIVKAVALGPDGTIYISDMVNGRIWRIIYQDRTKSQ